MIRDCNLWSASSIYLNMVFRCSQSSQTSSSSEDVTWSKTTLEDSLKLSDDSVGTVFAMHTPGPALIPSSHFKKLHTALIPELNQRIPVMFTLIVGQYEQLNSSSPWTFTNASLPVWYVKNMPVYFLFGIALIWLLVCLSQLSHFTNCLFSLLRWIFYYAALSVCVLLEILSL